MKPKLIVKLVVDFCMTGILLFLMLYERIGRVTHEWLGIAMFVLFLSHHILNRNWIRNLFRGGIYTISHSADITCVYCAGMYDWFHG